MQWHHYLPKLWAVCLACSSSLPTCHWAGRLGGISGVELAEVPLHVQLMLLCHALLRLSAGCNQACPNHVDCITVTPGRLDWVRMPSKSEVHLMIFGCSLQQVVAGSGWRHLSCSSPNDPPPLACGPTALTRPLMNQIPAQQAAMALKPMHACVSHQVSVIQSTV